MTAPGCRGPATEFLIPAWISTSAATSLERWWCQEWFAWPQSDTNAGLGIEHFGSDVGRARFLGKQVAVLFGCLAADQIPGAHGTLALDVDAAALLQDKLVLEARVHRLGHLNPSHRVGGFHPGRDIDRVAPHVVEEPAGNHDAPDHRAAGHAPPPQD